MEAMEERTSYVKPEDARKFAQGVLEGNGVPEGQAGIVARCLVEADLRGVDTHGTFGFLVVRLGYSYCYCGVVVEREVMCWVGLAWHSILTGRELRADENRIRWTIVFFVL